MQFSVTIPAYKKAFLKEAIDSILSQSFHDYEIVIVDDCSPEDIGSIIDQYAHDDRIHYYRNETNYGAFDVVDNWNRCLSLCKGDYVICMGDDDRLLPNCLSDYAKLIARYPEIEVLHTQTEIIDSNGDVLEILPPRPERESALSLLYFRWKNRLQFIGDFCFKTSSLRSRGGFYKFPLAWYSDDYTAFLAATSHGIANVGPTGFQYRTHDTTITSSGYERTKIEATRIAHDLFFQSLTTHNWDDSENKLLHLLLNDLEPHRKEVYLQCVYKDFVHHPTAIFYWLHRAKDYGLSSGSVIKQYLRSMAAHI